MGLGRRTVATFLSPRSADLRLLVQSEAPRHPKLLELYQQRSATPVWSPLIGQLARLAHKGILDIEDPRRAPGQFVTLVTGAGWHMTSAPSIPPPSTPTSSTPTSSPTSGSSSAPTVLPDRRRSATVSEWRPGRRN
jgi:hypothetical protein